MLRLNGRTLTRENGKSRHVLLAIGDVTERRKLEVELRRRPGSWSGMGPALCREIVERHGGEIRVESEPGEGSEFHAKLDLRPEEG